MHSKLLVYQGANGCYRSPTRPRIEGMHASDDAAMRCCDECVFVERFTEPALDRS
jgi:hypothetical protein